MIHWLFIGRLHCICLRRPFFAAGAGAGAATGAGATAFSAGFFLCYWLFLVFSLVSFSFFSGTHYFSFSVEFE